MAFDTHQQSSDLNQHYDIYHVSFGAPQRPRALIGRAPCDMPHRV